MKHGTLFDNRMTNVFDKSKKSHKFCKVKAYIYLSSSIQLQIQGYYRKGICFYDN